MKLRSTPEGVIVEDRQRERWVSLPRPRDMLTLLARGAETRAEVAEPDRGRRARVADPATAGLPFAPRSMRAFSLWPSHYEGSARMLVKRFFPPPVQRLAASFERVTGRTFPPFKPNRQLLRDPAFYLGNHTAMLADGEEMPWPSHTSYLDFELELAFVLAQPLADPPPPRRARRSGAGSCSTTGAPARCRPRRLATACSAPRSSRRPSPTRSAATCSAPTSCPTGPRRAGRVRVDGEVWCEGSTAGPAHDVGEMLAHAAAGERLEPAT